MEQIILQTIYRQQETETTQHAFMKVKICLINMMAFYNEVTCSVGEERMVDSIIFDFGTMSDTLSRNTLTDKLVKYGLDK